MEKLNTNNTVIYKLVTSQFLKNSTTKPLHSFNMSKYDGMFGAWS